MAGLHIPALGRKFRLLIDYGYFKDLDEIADVFGVKSNTLQWWCHGDGARPVDTIPNKHLSTLLEMISGCLPDHATAGEVKSFVYSSVTHWEDEFRSNSAISLSKLIETEAIRDCGELFLKPPQETGLIETDVKPLEPQPELSVLIHTWFRLEIQSQSKADHIIAVQNFGQSWGSVSAVFNKASGFIQLPGIRQDNGKLAHMRERQDIGIHRFIVFQSADPTPVEYRRYQDENIELDARILNHLADFFQGQNKNMRRLYQVDVEVTADQ